MDFNQSIKIVASVLSETGTIINAFDYDGVIVKKLEASNTLDDGRSTNQTHIAITGSQMDIFPYLRSDGYFNDTTTDSVLKKYFIGQIPLTLCKSNVDYLDNKQKTIFFESDKKRSYTSVVRSKRKAQADQIQVSLINFDSQDFIAFRKLLHVGSYLIILKLKQKFEYEVFGIIPNKGIVNDGGLKSLNNQFSKLATSTTVDVSMLLAQEKELSNYGSNPLIPGSNILFYGVPGSGKSYSVNKMLSELISEDKATRDTYSRRVVFHPEYTYSDFVGQILPQVKSESNEDGSENKRLDYEFVPGPFTDILKVAYANPDANCILVIEELNRGNAAAIFGELFQLLDRDDSGASEYSINNRDIATYIGLPNKPIHIPSNLSILATMNTSDQNVFTLDTAFQRRWHMKYVKNVFTKEHEEQELPNTTIKWKAFAEKVNEILANSEIGMGMSSTEDKGLGAYFAKGNDFNDAEQFAEKVLKYLWDDAFKMDREQLFKKDIKTLSQLIKLYTGSADGMQAILRKDAQHDYYAEMLKASSISDTTTQEQE